MTVNLTSCLALTVLTLALLSRVGVIDLDRLVTTQGRNEPRVDRVGNDDDADADARGVGVGVLFGRDAGPTAAQHVSAAAALRGQARDGGARGGGGGGGGGGILEGGAGEGDASADASRCFPPLAREDTWGTYASVPAYEGKTPEEELQSLTLAIDGTSDGVDGTSLGALGQQTPTPPTRSALTQFQRAMKTLRLPADCRVETGDAMTAAEDADGPHLPNLRLGSCAVVFPSGHLVGSGAGPQIESHDHVFRLNGHNAPGTFTLRANDFGHRTEFRALSSAAINAGLKHDIRWSTSERWLLYSACQHRNPQPWCSKLFVVLRQRPVAGLHFVPQEAHRAGSCLSALKREYLGPHRRYSNTPTTGFATLLYATRRCGCVTVFGLCNTTSCDQALKWAGHSDKTGWKDPVHDFHLEHLAALLMARDRPERVRLWVSHAGERQRQGWGAAAMAAAAGRIAERFRGGGGRGGKGDGAGGGGGGHNGTGGVFF